MTNSLSYLATLTARRRIVMHLLYTATFIESSYGKFFCYLLLSNLNIYIPVHEKIPMLNIEPDVDRNFDAWFKETTPVTHVFRIRREFVPFIREMIEQCNLLLDEDDLLPQERTLTLSFMGLIGAYCKGELFPKPTAEEFEYLRRMARRR